MDVLTPDQRRLNMSRIRGRDTKPEMVLRRGLHALGLRFRLHVRDLPGRPDLVFPGHRVVVFVHGCFWHAHNCPKFRLPSTRREFWTQKLLSNVERDRRAKIELLTRGWRVLVVWECSLGKTTTSQTAQTIERARNFILAAGGPAEREIPEAVDGL
jgi:DNA mismatch endonuclease (patch repair protein)